MDETLAASNQDLADDHPPPVSGRAIIRLADDRRMLNLTSSLHPPHRRAASPTEPGGVRIHFVEDLATPTRTAAKAFCMSPVTAGAYKATMSLGTGGPI